jgi:lycopene cyclase domain-containing protein
LNPKYYYLFLDIASFIFPFAFSFNARANFSKKWKYVIPAIVITAIPFIVWDEVFTRKGIWGFNEHYLTGFYLLSLPVEEILFFVCIPYACIFTYFALNHFFRSDPLSDYAKIITYILIGVCIVLAFVFHTQAYTFTTSVLLAGLLAFLMVNSVSYLSKFYRAFMVLLLPFFLVNGILTGSFIPEEVVWYKNAENTGIRISTIPLEDVFYAMLMILMTVAIAEWLEARNKKNSPGGL